MILIRVFGAAEWHLLVIRHAWVRVAQFTEISRPRTDIQITKQSVILFAGLGLRNFALGIENIAEVD